MFSPSSQSVDPESQALTDGGDLRKFSVKERVGPSTDAITRVSASDNVSRYGDNGWFKEETDF